MTLSIWVSIQNAAAFTNQIEGGLWGTGASTLEVRLAGMTGGCAGTAGEAEVTGTARVDGTAGDAGMADGAEVDGDAKVAGAGGWNGMSGTGREARAMASEDWNLMQSLPNQPMGCGGITSVIQ